MVDLQLGRITAPMKRPPTPSPSPPLILLLAFARCAVVFFGCAFLPLHAADRVSSIHSPTQTPLSAPAWKPHRPMMEPAFFAGTVAGSDGRIYVITGSTGESGELTSRNSAYDPERDTWTKLAPIPTPRSEPGAALGPDGNIYIIGGNPTRSRQQSSKMNVVEAYDLKNNQWTRCKPLPTPRTALCAATVSDKSGHAFIYAIGGRNFDMPGNGLSTLEAYDPTTDSWTTRSAMPINLHAMTATAGPDGKIYVLGGTNSRTDDTNLVQVYDPETDRWAPGIPMPFGQECACSAFIPGHNGEIVVMGGWGSLEKISLDLVAAYNPRTDTWRRLPKLITATAGAGAATVKSADGALHIYVIGGTPDPTCVQEYGG